MRGIDDGVPQGHLPLSVIKNHQTSTTINNNQKQSTTINTQYLSRWKSCQLVLRPFIFRFICSFCHFFIIINWRQSLCFLFCFCFCFACYYLLLWWWLWWWWWLICVELIIPHLRVWFMLMIFQTWNFDKIILWWFLTAESNWHLGKKDFLWCESRWYPLDLKMNGLCYVHQPPPPPPTPKGESKSEIFEWWMMRERESDGDWNSSHQHQHQHHHISVWEGGEGCV